MDYINANLNEIAEGALQERFNYELAKVAANVMDPNTEHKKKRKITITVEVSTDEYRDEIYLDSEVKSTLAPRKAVTSRAMIEREGDGTVHVNEIKSGQRGQMYFDTEDSRLKDDKGTPVEELESLAEKEESTLDISADSDSNKVFRFNDKKANNQ